MAIEEQVIHELMRSHQATIDVVQNLIRTIEADRKPRLFQKIVVTLDAVNNGVKPVDLPWATKYIGLVNETNLVITLSEGRLAQAEVGAIPVPSGGQQNYLTNDATKQVTIAWTGTPTAGNNAVVLFVSNEPVPLVATSPTVQPYNTAANPLYTALTGSNAMKITNDGTSSGLAVVVNPISTDSLAPGSQSLVNSGAALLYNDNTNTWQRQRNNTQGPLLASSTRTTSVISPQQTNYNARGVKVILKITATSGTGGLTVRIEDIDPISGDYLVLLAAPSAITALGVYEYELYPGDGTAIPNLATTPNSVNQRVAGALSRLWQARVLAGDSSSYTYSLSYSLII